ncbi:MAG: GNAT family N-acetyltransferase [Rhodobacteraceae bacterium]|nr:GNAT family N-acetyltransferase [Paracoccaceae bacterium]
MPSHRGKGLGKFLIVELMRHPDLRDVTGWMLSTHNLHHLYRQFGFKDAEQGRHLVMTRTEMDSAKP